MQSSSSHSTENLLFQQGMHHHYSPVDNNCITSSGSRLMNSYLSFEACQAWPFLSSVVSPMSNFTSGGFLSHFDNHTHQNHQNHHAAQHSFNPIHHILESPDDLSMSYCSNPSSSNSGEKDGLINENNASNLIMSHTSST
jgi:hypothetical protein